LIQILVAQGFFNAFAGIALPNPGSIALHESVGFKPLGVYHGVGYKLGAWHDVGWWQLVLQAQEAVPPEPRGIADIRQWPGWESLVTSGQSGVRDEAA